MVRKVTIILTMKGAMTTTIYTASDLKERRTEVLEAALRERAIVRAVDGTALVFTRLAEVERAELVSTWALDLHRAEHGDIPRGLRWFEHLDVEDRQECIAELWETLESDPLGLREVLDAWRITATAVSDPLRGEVLTGDLNSADFVAVARPK